MKNKFYKLKIILIITFISFLFTNLATADLFTYDMSLSSVANDTEQAKNEAINKGRLIALQSVMQKITSTKYNQIIIKELTIEDAINFEKSFKIKKEQFFAGKYVAEVNFTFDKNQVLKFLDANNIPYTESQGTKYLVIISNPEGDSLPNLDIWNFYWNRYNATDFSPNIVMYNNTGKLNLNKKEDLEKLKTKLEVQDIYLVNIVANKIIEPELPVDESLSLTNKEENDLSEKNQEDVIPIEPKYTYTLNISSVFHNYKLTEEVDEMAKAFMLTMQGVDDSNKNAIFARYRSHSDDLFLNIATSDYEKRVEIEKRIGSIAGISNIYVKEIEYGYIKLHISYRDNVAILKTELAKQCIDFNLDTFYLELYDECTV